MKTISLNLYNYEELSKEAQEKALKDYRNDAQDPYMQSMLNDECGQLLKEHGITCTSNHPVCLYSLSGCQGDGLMFEGTFTWNGYTVVVKQSGHYCHSNSKSIDITDEEGNTVDTEEPYSAFETIYQSICKKLEKQGYEHIEWIESEEYFKEMCDANGYTFEEDGTMRTE